MISEEKFETIIRDNEKLLQALKLSHHAILEYRKAIQEYKKAILKNRKRMDLLAIVAYSVSQLEKRMEKLESGLYKKL